MKKPVTISSLLVFAVIGALSFLVLSQRSEPKSETPDRTYRIGILNGLQYFVPITDGFRQRMSELGYIEGNNVYYDIYAAQAPIGNEETIKRFVAERVDVILAFPTESSLEAKAVAAGTGIPVVSGAILIEGNDFAESVSRPGGNVTGVNFGGTGIAVKRLEALHIIAPEIKTVMVPFLKGYPTVEPTLQAMRPVAENLGVTILETPFSSEEELKAYFGDQENHPVEAIIQISEPTSAMTGTTEAVWRWAEARNVPVLGAGVLDDEHGPVLSYQPDSREMGVMAAELVDKVLRGTPAGTIMMTTAKGYLNINLKVARKLGLTIGGDLLGQARTVIK